MKKLLLVLFIVVALTGCEPYSVETNTVFNLEPIESTLNLHVTREEDTLLFQVTQYGNILEADECILRNDNTHELYANFGDYENIIYVLDEDGYYTFGFYKDEVEVIYNFKLSELKPSQIINY